MPDLDEELIARAVRWCADAGRHASADQVRAALSPLSWDQLLSVRALLADPPPTGPLGPWALADLGRGTQPGIAAERERAGQYAAESPEPATSATPAVAPIAGPTTAEGGRRARRARGAAAPVIHRARDRVTTGDAGPVDRRALLESLLQSEGRAVLERLVRKHGARRAPIVRALAEGWRRGDGADPGPEDLDRLLQAHGLARTFERRERDELLHALRASAGVLGAAAARVGLGAEEFGAALRRLGAAEDAESIRDVHRAEIRRRATLTQRVRLLLGDAGRLADLGVLPDIEQDLRVRIPEHLRALRASRAFPLATALTQTLGMGPRELPVLLGRLGLTLDLGTPARAPGEERPAPTPGMPRGRGPSRRFGPGVPAGRSSPGRRATPRSEAHRPRAASDRRGTSPGSTPRRRGPSRRPPRPR